MAKKKRTILDDLTERVDEALRELERMLRGDRKKRALVPIPVRNDEPRYPPVDPYRR